MGIESQNKQLYVLWPFIFSFVEKYIYVCTTLHIYILHIIYVVTEEEGESLPSARSRDREQSLRPFLKNGQRKRATTQYTAVRKDGLMQKNVPSISPIDIKNLGVPSQIRLKYFNVILVLIEKNRTLLGGVIQTYPGIFFKKSLISKSQFPRKRSLTIYFFSGSPR